MTLTLGFSPCPNDTFIFDALVNKKIDTGDLEFEVVLEDVQTLNDWAKKGKLDVSKISYGVLPLLLKEYLLLNSGGALGKGVGPLLISKAGKINNIPESFDIATVASLIEDFTVAIPGENTTANLLFSLAFPNANNKKFMIFNEVENAVLNSSVKAGVIIHENRFTYQDKGLVKLADLGEYWERQTGLPIPLGGIVMRRRLDLELQLRVDRLIKESLKYAFSNYPAVSTYVKEHSQEMSEEVMRKHIDLYVNNFSIELGVDGKKAVHKLLEVFEYAGKENIFVK